MSFAPSMDFILRRTSSDNTASFRREIKLGAEIKISAFNLASSQLITVLLKLLTIVPTPTVAATAKAKAAIAIYVLLMFCMIDRDAIFPVMPNSDLKIGENIFSTIIIIRGVDNAKPIIIGRIPK